MLMTDLIVKKRDKQVLTKNEIEFMIREYVKGTIPDYQMSAMCMAILLNGMTDEETLNLTIAMTNSGDKIDLSGIEGVKADKHSTGGVGDKTSLVLCPMVAACGLKIAKMSGRGLGHTGGTLDKLESINGFNINVSEENFIKNVNKHGIAIIGQTADIDPADKKLYALRDVTGTVPSIPLIVSSIMSKKIASGADVIVLDVKCGDGSFMKDMDHASILANKLIEIGNGAGRKTAAVITDMDQPLGYAVGNALEVKEAIAVLKGEMKGDVLDLCLTIGSRMLTLAGIAESDAEASIMLTKALAKGKALDKLAELVEAQGGNKQCIYDVSLLPEASIRIDLKADNAGYVKKIKTEKIGLIAMALGGGRKTKDDIIDPAVGVVLNKKVADRVEIGDILATVHANDMDKAQKALEDLKKCFEYTDEQFERAPFIKAVM